MWLLNSCCFISFQSSTEFLDSSNITASWFLWFCSLCLKALRLTNVFRCTLRPVRFIGHKLDDYFHMSLGKLNWSLPLENYSLDLLISIVAMYTDIYEINNSNRFEFITDVKIENDGIDESSFLSEDDEGKVFPIFLKWF